MKVALYMRVSTEDQINENQKIRLMEFCQVRGYEVVEIFQEKESGGKRSRPELDLMLKKAKRGKFQGVVAVKVDRISRSLGDLLEISGSLGTWNVDLIFSDEDFDINSSQGRFMFQVLGAFAELERSMIRSRTKAGLRRAEREGKKLGRPKIHGGKVQKVHRLRDEGLSIRQISDEVGIGKSSVSRILKQGVPKTGGMKSDVSGVESEHVPKSTVLGTEGVDN